MTGESSQASLGDVSIGQLAEITGVPVKTIRYYSDEGLLPPRRRTAARYRRYGAADRVRLEQIRALRELGFGLDAIRRLLARGSDPAAVVAAQVAAIDRELTHLRRARAVLRGALAGADPAATTLRTGAIMRLAAWQREAALREHVAAPLRAAAVDPQWLDGLLTAAFGNLPDDLDDDQWAAYVELVALVTDPSFGAALARQAEGFWGRVRRFDAAGFQRDVTALVGRGAALLAAEPDLAPTSPAAQALAADYLAATARALGRRSTRGLAAMLRERLTEHDPRSERFWDLVAIIRRRPPPPHARVMRLVFAALAPDPSRGMRR